jgi:hypothetical protein
MAIAPSATERAGVRFAVGSGGFILRYALALGLFAIGWAVCCFAPFEVALIVGGLVILLGHLPLWVRGQSLAPGGATPDHEEVWVPADPDWYDRFEEMEKRARRWDLSPWDITSAPGVVVLGLITLGMVVSVAMVAEVIGEKAAHRAALAGGALWLPLWLNGMRSHWNPPELGLKGAVLRVAARVVRGPRTTERYEAVPLLALVEHRRGKVPVDARLMLRPVQDDGSGLIGIQVQVCLNNVRGKDYPYAYCVVLAKPGFVFPQLQTKLTCERGKGEDVVYMVVRQHADRHSGWHTDQHAVQGIVQTALRIADRGRLDNL